MLKCQCFLWYEIINYLCLLFLEIVAWKYQPVLQYNQSKFTTRIKWNCLHIWSSQKTVVYQHCKHHILKEDAFLELATGSTKTTARPRVDERDNTTTSFTFPSQPSLNTLGADEQGQSSVGKLWCYVVKNIERIPKWLATHCNLYDVLYCEHMWCRLMIRYFKVMSFDMWCILEVCKVILNFLCNRNFINTFKTD